MTDLELAPALRLDLGSGATPAPGFVGVDRHAVEGVEVMWDLDEYPWPFDTASVAELYSSHLVEHVVDLVAFMNEAGRVLVAGGTFTIRHPYQFSVWAWQDPTHRRALCETSWAYFDATWREANAMEHYLGITCDFETREIVPSVVDPAYAAGKVTEEEFRKAMAFQNNVVFELTVTLKNRGA